MSFECTFPWTGMTIDPQGKINVCCTYKDKRTTKYFFAKQAQRF